ncbi:MULTISPECIES: hypothetical protein [Streptomyces violaceusniger group]|uniref:Uncharacterized protein n=1 Tax=Streptomyces javensis TaxID=114698 RepID=A0ABN1WEC3_9ACTN|nr:hypothetical protein [Streptomyces javensis]
MSTDGIRTPERAWLGRLRPEDEAVVGSAVSDPMLVAEVVARVGRAAAGWAIEAGQAMAARRNVHGLSDVRYVHFRPRRSYEALALSAVVSLSGDHTPPAALRSEISALVREAVPRGVSVDVGLQGVQLFHSDFLGRLFDWCGAHLPPESQAEGMRQMSADLFEGMAALSALMAQEFAVTRDRWLAGAAAARQEMVRDVLAGREIDRDLAMSRLSYDLTVHHLALIAWSDTEVAGGADELADAATRLLTAAGCSSVLLVPTGTAKLWAWGGRVSGPPAPDPDRRSAPRDRGLPPHLRIALGRPGYAMVRACSSSMVKWSPSTMTSACGRLQSGAGSAPGGERPAPVAVVGGIGVHQDDGRLKPDSSMQHRARPHRGHPEEAHHLAHRVMEGCPAVVQ